MVQVFGKKRSKFIDIELKARKKMTKIIRKIGFAVLKTNGT